MSTAARKERKRAGIKFVREPKVATPIGDRREFNRIVQGPAGTRHSLEFAPVSMKRRDRMLLDRGIDPVTFWKNRRRAEGSARGHRKTKTPRAAA